jgi:hypothetical protein
MKCSRTDRLSDPLACADHFDRGSVARKFAPGGASIAIRSRRPTNRTVIRTPFTSTVRAWPSAYQSIDALFAGLEGSDGAAAGAHRSPNQKAGAESITFVMHDLHDPTRKSNGPKSAEVRLSRQRRPNERIQVPRSQLLGTWMIKVTEWQLGEASRQANILRCSVTDSTRRRMVPEDGR